MSVTHQAESLLDLFRQGQARVRSSHITALCRALDLTKRMLDQVEVECHDEGFEDEAREVVALLEAEMGRAGASEAEAGAGSTPAPPATSGEAGAPAPDDAAATTGAEKGPAALGSLVDDAEARLLHLAGASDDPAAATSAATALEALAARALEAERTDLAAGARELAARVQGAAPGSTASAGASGSLLAELDRLRRMLTESSPGQAPPAQGADEPSGAAPAADRTPSSSRAPSAAGSAASGGPQRPPGNADGGAPPPAPARPASRGNIRVDLEKLDALMDLVGELIIAETMVTHNPDLEGHHFESFQKAAIHLNRITRALQDVAMSVRMVPIGGVFRKMLRLVRDLAQKQGKHVQLLLAGEETEVDKTVVELIADPLVHILRNAVDHGLEPPEERERAGKPALGTIHLEARHESGEIWISISDDGRGLDAEAILEKAIERGLIDPSSHEPSEAEIFRCIFQPGFSTARQVTDVSGRGVGMDVVRRNIEELRGRVEVASAPGRGTTITIRLPLTLAIIEGMLVRVGSTTYTVPLLSIRESVSVKEEDLTRLSDGQEMVHIRGQLMPMVRLYAYHGLEPASRRIEDGILVVVEDGGAPFGVLVDQILGQRQTVIEGLPPYLGPVRGISGCSILSNGDISFILDVGALRSTWSARN